MRFIFFAILLLSCKVICAQQEPLTAPLLVDSYDDKIHSSEAEQWHLEDLREKLLKQPGTKTYIIASHGECCKACVRSSRNSYALRDKKPARRK